MVVELLKFSIFHVLFCSALLLCWSAAVALYESMQPPISVLKIDENATGTIRRFVTADAVGHFKFDTCKFDTRKFASTDENNVFIPSKTGTLEFNEPDQD